MRFMDRPSRRFDRLYLDMSKLSTVGGMLRTPSPERPLGGGCRRRVLRPRQLLLTLCMAPCRLELAFVEKDFHDLSLVRRCEGLEDLPRPEDILEGDVDLCRAMHSGRTGRSGWS